jgi:oligosaccharyltransferase complex subunit gamma
MLQTAPVILIFQPTLGPDAKLDGQPIRFDLQSSQSAEQMHGWVSRNLPPGPRPPLVRPFNYVGLITSTTLVLGLITFVTVAKPYILPIIQNRNLWAGVSLIAILLFTSGHMFNHIRKVPYVSGDGKGGITYFAGGFSNQFGMETQIVAAMCKLANQYPSILAVLTKLNRWTVVIRDYCARFEGTSDGRSKKPASSCLHLGICNFGNV